MAQFSKYSSLKLLISYFLLLGLMAGAVWFLFQQQSNLDKQISVQNTDKKQLIYTELIRDLYESDNYARVALQMDDDKSKKLFLTKNASVVAKIENLQSTELSADKNILDTLKIYLKDKEQNVLNIRKLQAHVEESPIGEVLNKIRNLENVKGKLTLDSFIQNPKELSSYERNVAQDYINYLNNNVPRDSSNTISVAEADSIVSVSKRLLEDAQKKINKRSVTIKNKEIELLQNELRITQKLSDIILQLRNVAEQEAAKIHAIKTNNQKETLALLQKGAIACVAVVLFFFILLSSDFFRNKTYRQRLELEQQKTDQLLESREQLMTMVSHDIKTPLQSLLGYSEKLLASESQVENRDALIKIKSATNYIQQLVSGLLDYVRMEKGKVAIMESAFELNILIEEIAQNIADLNQEKDVELNYKIDATEGFLYYGDYSKIQQIFYNLIGNAFKFTENGSVTIETTILDNQLEIIIQDTGIGISKDEISKLFKPFSQANSEIELLYGGTGLGLSICNRLIQLLGGKIELESQLNFGSKFHISLPIKLVPIKEKRQKIDLKSCLLLDDDENQLALTKSLLAPHFKEIFTFTNGKKAIQFLDKEQVSLLITDIQMPFLSGFEFLKAVKSNPHLSKTPIVAITGALLNDEEFLTSDRFDYFLAKPYSSAQLLDIISELSHQDLEIVEKRNTSIPAFLMDFIGNDTQKINEFLANYLTDFEQDKLVFNLAIEQSDLQSIGSTVHKMQTMISQFQEQELLTMLKDLEEKTKRVATINEISTELNQLELALKEFHIKIKRLVQTD
ncbi:hybrid sensor histidine kinase/response regulator [Flavobacterium ardleyense]|uniref:histidine kinase n=1 Tax=Flavobacterium ardleyense TaxID=2038737 RepID=A0ABW5Z8P8_9FLAO